MTALNIICLVLIFSINNFTLAQNLPSKMPLPVQPIPKALPPLAPTLNPTQNSAAIPAPASGPRPGPAPAPAPGSAPAPVNIKEPSPLQPPPITDFSEKRQGGSTDLLSGIIEDYTYVPAHKRDPFTPYEAANSGGTMIGPEFPLQRFDVDQLKLVGIIWDVRHPKAMILDPQGAGYVVKLNERIGRNSGFVARIRESEVIIVEKYKGSDGVISSVTKLMKLSN
jgi:type IV pilus assembly protein PilP